MMTSPSPARKSATKIWLISRVEGAAAAAGPNTEAATNAAAAAAVAAAAPGAASCATTSAEAAAYKAPGEVREWTSAGPAATQPVVAGREKPATAATAAKGHAAGSTVAIPVRDGQAAFSRKGRPYKSAAAATATGDH